MWKWYKRKNIVLYILILTLGVCLLIGRIYANRIIVTKITDEILINVNEGAGSNWRRKIENGKVGLIDKNNNWKIPPKFDAIQLFGKRTLTSVRIKDKYGMINLNGDLVLPVMFDAVGDMVNGAVLVRINQREGFVNTFGNLITLDNGSNFIGDQFNKTGLIRVCVSNLNSCFFEEHGENIKYLTIEGEWVSPESFVFGFEFSEDLGLAPVKKWSTGKWGVINKQGVWVVPAIFDNIQPFSINGLAQACIEGDGLNCEDGGLWGFINTHGNWVISPKYHAVWPFEKNGLARVCINCVGVFGKNDHDYWNLSSDKWGFINEKGELVTPMIFDFISASDRNKQVSSKDDLAFDENNFSVVKLLDKSGVINKSGEWVVPPKFDQVWPFGKNNFAKVCIGESREYCDRYGFINKEGEVVIPLVFDDADISNDRVIVKVGSKWGSINTNGEWKIPAIYDQVEVWFDDLAILKKGEKYFMINEMFEIVGEFDDYYAFDHDYNGLWFVKNNGKWRHINSQGKYLEAE